MTLGIHLWDGEMGWDPLEGTPDWALGHETAFRRTFPYVPLTFRALSRQGGLSVKMGLSPQDPPKSLDEGARDDALPRGITTIFQLFSRHS